MKKRNKKGSRLFGLIVIYTDRGGAHRVGGRGLRFFFNAVLRTKDKPTNDNLKGQSLHKIEHLFHHVEFSTKPNPPFLLPLLVLHYSWSYVSVDFITGLPLSNNFTILLIIVDRFSKVTWFAINIGQTKCINQEVIDLELN